MAYNIHNLYPTFTHPDEAEQIEIVRRRLMVQSEKVRNGSNRFPGLTARRLAKAATYLANSNAPEFEKIHTLNIAEANFRARGVNERSIHTITELSQQALQNAFPPTEDPITSELNEVDVLARRRAIEHTAPDKPFLIALDEAWTDLGHPIDTPWGLNRYSRQLLQLEKETSEMEAQADAPPTQK